mmetsp:Transcript_11775/g.37645  ORF Transcript_11775/g.37645 Transcript_11775/m.37645 type:complete len:214 (-) Transcript_11775:203-844(-)
MAAAAPVCNHRSSSPQGTARTPPAPSHSGTSLPGTRWARATPPGTCSPPDTRRPSHRPQEQAPPRPGRSSGRPRTAPCRWSALSRCSAGPACMGCSPSHWSAGCRCRRCLRGTGWANRCPAGSSSQQDTRLRRTSPPGCATSPRSRNRTPPRTRPWARTGRCPRSTCPGRTPRTPTSCQCLAPRRNVQRGTASAATRPAHSTSRAGNPLAPWC